MTMILSAMTREFVFAVSDRRLTNSATGDVFDQENKAVVLNGQMVLGYTGFADLGGKATDLWVLDVLAAKSPREYVSTLVRAATVAVRRLGVRPKVRRHAFLLVGYERTPRGPNMCLPINVLISNYHADDLMERSEASDAFSASLIRLGNQRTSVFSVGRTLTSPEKRELKKTIWSCVRGGSDRPYRVLEVLANMVWTVAERDSGVGKNLMLISFPRTAYGAGGITIPIDFGAAEWNNQIIAAYAGEGSGVVYYSPAAIFPQFQVAASGMAGDPDLSEPFFRRDFLAPRQIS